MAQIAFLTLFLGLTLGPQPVELTVAGPVAVVELLLDGAPVGRIAGPPWRGEIDFGPALVPHELSARALDGEGKEIGRVRQWINLPRPPAEVDILLEYGTGAGNRPVGARLTWQSLTGEAPSAVGVTFDGKPLIMEEGGRVRLPAWDPAISHVLTAELRFSGALTARRDVVFGGEYGDQVSTDLTAVPVRLRPGKTLPPPERMRGWFRSGGQALSVAAVDEGPAELLVVRDLALRVPLQKLVSPSRSSTVADPDDVGSASGNSEARRFHMTLDQGDAVRFIWPVAKAVRTGAGLPAELFDASRDFDARDGGLLWFLARALPQVDNPARQRLADAVAVAGLQALYANHRRAVLLVLSGQPTDTSRSEPALIRRYLESIRVPLIVWTLGDPSSPGVAAWGKAEPVSTHGKMRKAFSRLEEDLASQRIVWIDGRHLPQSIELSAEAAAVLGAL